MKNNKQFEEYWNNIFNISIKMNLYPESTVAGFRIFRMKEILEKQRSCCKEMLPTFLFRLNEIHDEALRYAKLYGVIDDEYQYPFKDNYKDILVDYIIVKE